MFVQALSSYINQDLRDAKEKFEALLVEDPVYPDAEIYLAKVQWKIYFPYVFPLILIVLLGIVVKKIYDKFPEYRLKGNLQQARKYVRSGFFSDGLAIYSKINSHLLDDYQKMVMNMDMSLAYRKTGDFDAAIVKAREALRMDPKNEEAKETLGWCYLGKKMANPETVTRLLELYAKEKNNIALVELLAKFYMATKSTKKEALEVYERLVFLDQGNLETRRFLCQHYLKSRKADAKVLKLFQSMADACPEELDVKLGLSRILLSENRVEECLDILNDVIHRDINNEGVHAVFRDAYRKVNQLDLLMEFYEKLLEANPHNIHVQKGYNDCKKIAGIADEAPQRSGSLAERLGQEMSGSTAAVHNPFEETMSPFSESAGEQFAETSEVDNPFGQSDEGVPPQSADPSDSVPCRHCRYINTKGDYYCQGCGQPMN